mmetsp:Transcript_8342/g.21951  ORF Transcript_8342/g.21951 Transcript_8342/m.21951 type:complete len:213 (+) Transcript_8342:471-1109(+)
MSQFSGRGRLSRSHMEQTGRAHPTKRRRLRVRAAPRAHPRVTDARESLEWLDSAGRRAVEADRVQLGLGFFMDGAFCARSKAPAKRGRHESVSVARVREDFLVFSASARKRSTANSRRAPVSGTTGLLADQQDHRLQRCVLCVCTLSSASFGHGVSAKADQSGVQLLPSQQWRQMELISGELPRSFYSLPCYSRRHGTCSDACRSYGKNHRL